VRRILNAVFAVPGILSIRKVPLVVLLVLPISLVAQQNPNDAPVQVLSQPDGPQTAFLKQHPDAVLLTSDQGRLVFGNPNASLTAIAGSVTHRDLTTGNWVQNAPVLSSTNNGWRLDGTDNALIIRKSGQNHTITQTYTDYATKHDSTLSITVPSLTYDKSLGFHFPQSGLTWTLLIDPAGTLSFETTVEARRGAAAYSFPVSSSESLSVSASGDLAGDAHVNLSRAVMIPRHGKAVPCSPWSISKQGIATFTCDDSALKDSQLPYRIDPLTQTLTSGSTYSASGSCGTGYDGYPEDYWVCVSHDATVPFNTAGIVPTGSIINQLSCAYNIDWTDNRHWNGFLLIFRGLAI